LSKRVQSVVGFAADANRHEAARSARCAPEQRVSKRAAATGFLFQTNARLSQGSESGNLRNPVRAVFLTVRYRAYRVGRTFTVTRPGSAICTL
jgi:hypothetical protein